MAKPRRPLDGEVGPASGLASDYIRPVETGTDPFAYNAQGTQLFDQNGQPGYVDGQGRQYWMVDGQKSYPDTHPGQNANGGLLHNPDTWNTKTGQYDKGKLDWWNVVPYLGLAGIGGGAAAAALAGGAGATSAGGALASTQVGTGMVPAITGGVSGAGMTGAGAAGTAGLASTTIGSGMVPSIAGGTGSVGAGGGGMGWLDMALKAYDAYNKASPAIDALGRVASGASAGRAAGRVQEAGVNQAQDRTALQAAALNLQAPGMRAGNSVRGDILAGLKPVSINGPVTHTGGHIPQISGGLTPDLLSGNTRQLGGLMSRDALLSQMQGPAFTPTPLPQAGGADTALNTIGGIGAVAGALNQSGLLDKYRKQIQDAANTNAGEG